MFSRAATLENGKQAIKTAVAGVVSLFVTQLFHLPEGYWAAISALIVMQSNVGATLSASRTRLGGTAVGAVVGGAFVALWGVNMLGFALAIAIAFFLCFVLRLPESQRLATVTVAIIMLIGRSTSPWIIALHRFVEVSVGILIALLISLVVWPNHARQSLREALAASLVKLCALYQAVIGAHPADASGPLETLNAQVSNAFAKNAALLQNALQEVFGPMRERESLELLAAQVERIRHAVETLELALRNGAPDTYVREFEAELAKTHACIAGAFASLAGSIRTGKPESRWPELSQAISALEKKAAEVRTSGKAARYPLDDILRFYSILLSTRNLAQELAMAREMPASGLPAK